MNSSTKEFVSLNKRFLSMIIYLHFGQAKSMPGNHTCVEF